MVEPFAIETHELRKAFGEQVAVKGLTLQVKQGEVFGFLGPNGAGKTTSIKMLLGLVAPTSGNAMLLGAPLGDRVTRGRMGFLPEHFRFQDWLTAGEFLELHGRLHRMEPRDLKRRSNELLERVGLTAFRGKFLRTFSKGMLQRIGLAQALLNRPRLVFLDEPTGGVDPASRRRFWELINGLSEGGITVFVTTHYLDEAEYCNDIRLIHAGRIVAGGSPQELKTRYIENPILEVSCDRTVEAMEILQKEPWVLETSIFGLALHISVGDEEEGKRLVRARLARAGIAVDRVDRIMPSLEDVFIHKIEEQAVSPAAEEVRP